MPHEMIVDGVVETLAGGDLKHPAWRVDIIKPNLGIDGHWFNGTVHNQHIPKAALEWRIAEYDMEVEEAIDLLLHEPFMNTALQLPEAEDDVRRITPMVTRTVVIQGVTVEQPVDLYNATSVEEATQAMRTRLSVVKRRLQVVSRNVTRKTISGAPVQDPLDVIRNTHNVTRSGINEKKQFVRAMRQENGLDTHLRRVQLPERYGNPMVVQPRPYEDGAPRRILEQKRDLEDRMWN